MTTTVVLVVVFVAIAVLVSQLVKSRKPEPPTQRTYGIPSQLDRNDFVRPDAEWIVVAFTSATCDSCATVVSKVQVLESAKVAVSVLAYQDQKPLHERYGIDAVPTVAFADIDGVVQKSFVGPVSAADLWAALAELQEPGSTPPPEAHVPRLPRSD